MLVLMLTEDGRFALTDHAPSESESESGLLRLSGGRTLRTQGLSVGERWGRYDRLRTPDEVVLSAGEGSTTIGVWHAGCAWPIHREKADEAATRILDDAGALYQRSFQAASDAAVQNEHKSGQLQLGLVITVTVVAALASVVMLLATLSGWW